MTAFTASGVKEPESRPEDIRTEEVRPEDDPWAVTEIKTTSKPWKELSTSERVVRVVTIIIRVILVFVLLYLFICSLDFLSSAFRLLGGRVAGKALTDSSLLDNPVCGLMIGVLVTVLLQSSSTSTSITVTLVASNMISVRQGVFIIMGANVGTSVTCIIVSLTQSGDRNQFRRAFGGATVHDMFNWLTVLVLMPLEAATGVLVKLTGVMTRNLAYQSGQKPPELLKALTQPFTQLIIQLDNNVIEAVATDSHLKKRTMIKYFCREKYNNYSRVFSDNSTAQTFINNKTSEYWVSGVRSTFDGTKLTVFVKQVSLTESTSCRFLFHGQGLPDATLSEVAVGGILLVMAIACLMAALIVMVKVLHSLLQGPLFSGIKKVINAQFPGKAACLTGYFAILVGAGMTMLVQSSSIFTSTLTPLVGIGVVTIERVFPLTLGSNIGTTFTGILAALVQSSDRFRQAIQLALCHLFFNILGISIWFPVPFLRRLPIFLAKSLGNITSKYRWFGILYLVVIFFLLPGTIFGLSVAGWQVFVGVGVPILILVIFIIIVNILQKKKPKALPSILKSWDFLPTPLHSLEPYDNFIKKIRLKVKECSCNCCTSNDSVESSDNIDISVVNEGKVNRGYESTASLAPRDNRLKDTHPQNHSSQIPDTHPTNQSHSPHIPDTTIPIYLIGLNKEDSRCSPHHVYIHL